MLYMIEVDKDHSLDMVIFKEFNSALAELQNANLEFLSPIRQMYILDEDLLEFEGRSKNIYVQVYHTTHL